MKDLLGWRLAALKNGFLDATAYRVEFALEVIGSMIVPVGVQVLLWYAMFILGENETIAGMTFTDMMYYTLASALFSQVRGGNHDFELAEMIRSGHLSQYLLKPVSCVEFVFVRGVAAKLFIAVICMVIGMVLSFWTDLSAMRMVGAMGLAIIGNIIHYQIGAALASVAFYWEESYSVLMVKNLTVQILSGELIPLYLFPASMAWIWQSTPFYLYVFGPSQYALGRWSHEEFFYQCALGLGWIIFSWVLIKITWGIGLKNYSSLGG